MSHSEKYGRSLHAQNVFNRPEIGNAVTIKSGAIVDINSPDDGVCTDVLEEDFKGTVVGYLPNRIILKAPYSELHITAPISKIIGCD